MGATDGHGADVIIDFIGADYAQKNFEVAAMDARIVQLASLSGSVLPAGLDIGILERKRIRWEGSRLRSRDIELYPEMTLCNHPYHPSHATQCKCKVLWHLFPFPITHSSPLTHSTINHHPLPHLLTTQTPTGLAPVL